MGFEKMELRTIKKSDGNAERQRLKERWIDREKG